MAGSDKAYKYSQSTHYNRETGHYEANSTYGNDKAARDCYDKDLSGRSTRGERTTSAILRQRTMSLELSINKPEIENLRVPEVKILDMALTARGAIPQRLCNERRSSLGERC
jgi:hypothetical protein